MPAAHAHMRGKNAALPPLPGRSSVLAATARDGPAAAPARPQLQLTAPPTHAPAPASSPAPSPAPAPRARPPSGVTLSSTLATYQEPPRHSTAVLRSVLEDFRRRQNERMLHVMAVEAGGESMRRRAVALASSSGEVRRLQRLHAVQRVESRGAVLRHAVSDELELVRKLRELKVRSLAALVDDD
jgi:hypothetical protein